MSIGDLKPWEPEETVGTIWHRFVTGVDERASFPDAAVHLEDMATRLGVLFRALGGAQGTDIVPAAVSISRHRMSRFRRLGMAGEEIERTTYDGETLALPSLIDLFPDKSDNANLYLWLAAMGAFVPPLEPSGQADLLAHDIAVLRSALAGVRATLKACPGLKPIYKRLCSATLFLRRKMQRPPLEADMEAVIRAALGDNTELSESARQLSLLMADNEPYLPFSDPPRNYRSPEPVPLWIERCPHPAPCRGPVRDPDQSSGGSRAEGQNKRKKAERRNPSEAKRRDSLILHRFETILSWTQFLNINRRVEDSDPDSARRAADDQEELGLAEVEQRPATKLAFDLDMAPQDIDRIHLSGEHLFPEWDYRARTYRQNGCRVLFSDATAPEMDAPPFIDALTRRRINAVKRRFEALRPKRAILPRQVDGDDLDMDALVRSLVDIQASGEGSDRIYRRIVNAERDLAVATLIDVSRSTEAVVEERPVIEIAREALTAFGHGLQATGDVHAIYAFSSLRADKVFMNRCKAFDEPMNVAVERRIAGLRPGFYTRLGAAIRFVSKQLAERAAERRLLLIITDGKPNDIDHYEGRFGFEDTRMAVIEARRLGHAVFGVAIDAKARQYVPHLFGRGAYAMISRAESLPGALPLLYRQLVN